MRNLLLIVMTSFTVLLAGCTGFQQTNSAPTAIEAGTLHGKAFGGQQPVSGSAIQIWQAGSTGYGTGALALLPNGGVLTDANGNFSIMRSSYTCTSGSQLYITATGGNPGGGTNPVLALMAALGLCDNVTSNTYVLINEVTTVGAVWALSPFMQGTADSLTVGAPASNSSGLTSAFMDAASLVNIGTGSAVTSSANATLPTAEIYALANSLAACINSTGPSRLGNSACDKLFTFTTPSASEAPANTLAAALNIARSPTTHANDILALATPQSPFLSNFTSATDLTLAVTYTGGGLGAPSAVALDAAGNVWVTNPSTNTVTELAHNGTFLSGTAGYSGAFNDPSALAIDTAGNAWITNAGNSTLTELTASGVPANRSPFIGGGLSTPSGIAIDGLGNLWIADAGTSQMSEFSSHGTAITASGYAFGGESGPLAVAIFPQ